MKAKIDLLEYQDWVIGKWISSEEPIANELRIVAGVGGEAGEFGEKVKKFHRAIANGADPGKISQKLRADVAKELGDVMFYVAMAANFYDLDLDTILALNVEKLEDRVDREVIDGEGDER